MTTSPHERAVGVSIAVVSVGPDREQTITLHPHSLASLSPTMTYQEALHFLYTATPVFQRDGGSAYKPGLETTEPSMPTTSTHTPPIRRSTWQGRMARALPHTA